MSIQLNLSPEIEEVLLAHAHAQGVSLSDYLEQMAEREAQGCGRVAPGTTGQALVDACAKVRGLLTDEEIDAISR